MELLDWIFLITCGIWIAEFGLFRNRMISSADPQEKRSFFMIFGVLLGTILLSVMLSSFSIVAAGPFEKMAGLAFFITGIGLRYWGILHLKHQFTRHVTVREGDRLVSSGPYRLLRHPLYTGLLFITIGMPLFFGALPLVPVGGLAMVLALHKRIVVEEQLLIQEFGDEYKEWMQKRARLLPYIY